MRRTARSWPTMRASRRSSKSCALGLFWSGSRKTVSSNFLSGVAIVRIQYHGFHPYFQLPWAVGSSRGSSYAKSDPLSQLMRGVISAFALAGFSLNPQRFAYAIYTTDTQKSSKMFGWQPAIIEGKELTTRENVTIHGTL